MLSASGSVTVRRSIARALHARARYQRGDVVQSKVKGSELHCACYLLYLISVCFTIIPFYVSQLIRVQVVA